MNIYDSILYRPLRSGKEYEGLIPTYQGIDHNFDKTNDNSTTYDTLKYMALWANKYANQMSKVAPMMKGRSLQETINNIYSFLYNHFQYKLDGETQQLFSPSAAWFYRKTGFDCKTFSILASTILQNLKIQHSFRMVQQAGIMPGQWSHVYVVVPEGNKHYIIDATTHDNKEVSFTNKYDHQMKHIGLAAPYVNGLSCACTGNPINKRGLGSPSILSDTISNFHDFLNDLERNGISKEVTSRMLTLVKWNVENGIDPNMGDILNKAILSQQGLGAIQPISSLNPTGFTVPLPTAGGIPNNYTTPIRADSFGSSVKSAGYSALSNISVGGISAGSVMSAATGDPMAIAGLALTALKKIIPVDKTFGQLFSNGFKLSCWGSSTPPSLTKTWVANDLPLVYSKTIGAGITQQNLNLFIDTMNKMTVVANNWAADMRDCSKDGLTQYAQAAKNAKDQVITELKNIVQLIPQGSVRVQGMVFPIKLSDIKFSDGLDSFDSERYQIVFQSTAAESNNTSNNTNNNTDVTVANPSAKKSGSTPLLLGAGLLALKLLL